jgi:hypothetical protein
LCPLPQIIELDAVEKSVRITRSAERRVIRAIACPIGNCDTRIVVLDHPTIRANYRPALSAQHEESTMVKISLILAAMVAASHATGAAVPARPVAGCNFPEYRQLDFWVGDWDTFEPGDAHTSVARTHVDLIAAGCAVHELYEQTDGLIGDSILSFDPVRKQWQQTWVTNFGSLMVVTGQFKDGALTLEGSSHARSGKELLQKIVWKADGKGVRESSVMSKDSGKTWEPAFDVLFLKHH